MLVIVLVDNNRRHSRGNKSYIVIIPESIINFKELKDKIDELWNQADVETKVDRKVYIYDDDSENYYFVDNIFIDESKDVIIEINTSDVA